MKSKLTFIIILLMIPKLIMQHTIRGTVLDANSLSLFRVFRYNLTAIVFNAMERIEGGKRFYIISLGSIITRKF